jgi:hypothetical protein
MKEVKHVGLSHDEVRRVVGINNRYILPKNVKLPRWGKTLEERKAYSREYGRLYRKHVLNWQAGKVDRWLKRKYRTSNEEMSRLLRFQNYACGICKKEIGRKPNTVYKDHDHETMEIRGLLCTSCNLALGKLGDTLEGVQRAVDYLKNPPLLSLRKALFVNPVGNREEAIHG